MKIAMIEVSEKIKGFAQENSAKKRKSDKKK